MKRTINQEIFGIGASPNLIAPRDATLYLTIKGKSFARYISI